MDNAEKRLEEMLADEFWRLNHLYWIETKTGELVRFRMNWAQLAFWKEFWYRDDILKSRQLGLSTYVPLMLGLLPVPAPDSRRASLIRLLRMPRRS